MFIYEDKNQAVSTSELQQKWLMFRRFFNVKPLKAGYSGHHNDDQTLNLMLNQFYKQEIVNTHKFNEIMLFDGVRQSFFNDIVVNHGI